MTITHLRNHGGGAYLHVIAVEVVFPETLGHNRTKTKHFGELDKPRGDDVGQSAHATSHVTHRVSPQHQVPIVQLGVDTG